MAEMWEINKTLNAKSESVTLETAGKYVDRDIKVTATAKDGELEQKASSLVITAGDGHAAVTSTDVILVAADDKEVGATYFEITGTGSGDVSAKATAKVGVKTEGWVDSTQEVDISETDSATSKVATEKVYVKEAGVTVEEKSNTVEMTSTETGFTASTTTTPYSVKMEASGAVTVTGSVTAGYTQGKSEDSSVTVTKDKTVYIPASGLSNSLPSGEAEADYPSGDASAPVLTDGGYLYIKGGFIPQQKISLAKLVPDGSDVGEATNSAAIRQGFTSRNDDGKLVTGTMVDATVVSGTAEIDTVTFTYDSAADNYEITGSADVSAPTVSTLGYISSTEGTRSGNVGGATLKATVDATKFNIVTTAAKVEDTIPGGQYIKISAGYNPTDVYYKAQSQGEGQAAVIEAALNTEKTQYVVSATTAGYATGELLNIPVYQGAWS